MFPRSPQSAGMSHLQLVCHHRSLPRASLSGHVRTGDAETGLLVWDAPGKAPRQHPILSGLGDSFLLLLPTCLPEGLRNQEARGGGACKPHTQKAHLRARRVENVQMKEECCFWAAKPGGPSNRATETRAVRRLLWEQREGCPDP